MDYGVKAKCKIEELWIDLKELSSIIDENNSRPKVTIEALIYSLHADENHLDVRFSNTTKIDLEHLATILKRNITVEDKFATISRPGKIRITIERID